MESRKEATQVIQLTNPSIVEKAAQTIQLTDLPHELLLRILQYLDYSTLLNVSYVSKSFHSLCENESLPTHFNPQLEWLKIPRQEKKFSEPNSGSDLQIIQFQGQKILLSIRDDHKVSSRDLKTGEILYLFQGHTALISTMVSFNYQEHMLLVTGSFDKTVRIWDLQTGKHLKTFSPDDYEVFALTIFPHDGKIFLITGTFGPNISIWNLSALSFDIFHWSAENLPSPFLIKRWDPSTPQQGISYLQVLPGEKPLLVLAPFYPGILRVWDIHTGEEQRYASQEKDLPIRFRYLGVACTTEESSFQIIYSGLYENDIHSWNIHNDTRQTITIFNNFHSLSPRPFHFPSKKESIQVRNNSGTVHTLSHQSNQLQVILLKRKIKDTIQSILISKDQNFLYIWNVETGECITQVSISDFFTLNISPGTQGDFQVIAATHDQKIIIFSFTPSNMIKKLSQEEKIVQTPEKTNNPFFKTTSKITFFPPRTKEDSSSEDVVDSDDNSSDEDFSDSDDDFLDEAFSELSMERESGENYQPK